MSCRRAGRMERDKSSGKVGEKDRVYRDNIQGRERKEKNENR